MLSTVNDSRRRLYLFSLLCHLICDISAVCCFVTSMGLYSFITIVLNMVLYKHIILCVDFWWVTRHMPLPGTTDQISVQPYTGRMFPPETSLWWSSPPLLSLSKTLITKVPVTLLPQRHKSAWSRKFKVLTQFDIRFITAKASWCCMC